MAVTPAPVLPPPEGRFAVGTTRFELIRDGRRLLVYVWYPSADAPSDPRAWRTPAEMGAFIAGYARLGISIDPNTPMRLTNGRENAKPAPGRHPLVLFNHGGGLDPLHNIVLAEMLAASGYVFCSVGHAGESLGLAFGDGDAVLIDPAMLSRLSPAPAAMRALAESLRPGPAAERAAAIGRFVAADDGALAALSAAWAEDAIAVANAVAAAGTIPGTTIAVDADRRAYAGMSLGGSAAFDACWIDPAARAGINLDGVNWSFDRIGRQVPTPFLQIYANGTEEAAQLRAAHPDLFAADARPARANDLHYEPADRWGGRTDVLRLVAAGFGHMDFTDRALADPGGWGDTGPMTAIARICRAFLDWALCGGQRAELDAAIAAAPVARQSPPFATSSA